MQKKRKICPVCKKGEICWYAGGTTGSYQCRECGYVGPIIIEEEKLERKRK